MVFVYTFCKKCCDADAIPIQSKSTSQLIKARIGAPNVSANTFVQTHIIASGTITDMCSESDSVTDDMLGARLCPWYRLFRYALYSESRTWRHVCCYPWASSL